MTLLDVVGHFNAVGNENGYVHIFNEFIFNACHKFISSLNPHEFQNSFRYCF